MSQRTCTAAEAAGEIGVGYDWLARQAHAHKILHRCFGRKYVFTAEDTARIIEQHACEPRQEQGTSGLSPRSATRLARDPS